MDYKEKYEQALERMKAWAEGKYPECFDSMQKTAELIFPELKESEGEGIREKLINTFEFYNQAMDSPYLLGVHKKDIIAWLEKQGEQKSNYCNPEVDLSNCSEEYRKAYYDGYNKCNRDWHRQSEQKETLCDRCRKEQPSHSCQDITALGRCALEYQGEQKSADKPKFKVEKGEWYVCTQTFVLRGAIVVIKGQTYKPNQNGAIEGENKHLFIDTHDGKASDYFRLWTIQDAKDGDVLVDVYGNIGIFKQYDDFDWTSYCSLGVNGGFQHFKVEHKNEKTYPATKEQRDTLMKAMADAGYEWDAEKKELKKIEQTLAWSNTDLISLGYLAYFVDKNGDKFYGKNKPNVVKWIHSLANRTTPQQEWSEEDKRNLDWLITVCERIHYKSDPQVSPKSALILRDWLKFLKDRVQLKQEWSEKDEVGFGDATWAIEQARTIAKDENDMGNLWYAEHWLKSLKDRYTWKPSKEQIEALEHFVRSIGESGYASPYDTNTKLVYSLLQDLKKLKKNTL